jgi:hypothetical protein
MLNTFTPDLYVQYFRDLRDMTASGRPVARAAIAQVMAAYATTEIRQDPAWPASAARTPLTPWPLREEKDR